jgi:hypothetical protein
VKGPVVPYDHDSFNDIGHLVIGNGNHRDFFEEGSLLTDPAATIYAPSWAQADAGSFRPTQPVVM